MSLLIKSESNINLCKAKFISQILFTLYTYSADFKNMMMKFLKVKFVMFKCIQEVFTEYFPYAKHHCRRGGKFKDMESAWKRAYNPVTMQNDA